MDLQVRGAWVTLVDLIEKMGSSLASDACFILEK